MVVLDRWMKSRAEQHGAKPENIHVIPPWPAHNFTLWGEGLPPKENSFRTESGLDGKFVLLYSGNHSIVHPLDTILHAALFMRDDPGVVFAFIGGGLRVEEVSAFKERHELGNIVQLPHQPRERLHETLTFADIHWVVMGNKVTGLVHTSKVYGVLATGRPYIFVGPRDSHVSDLLSSYPYGFQVEHSDVDGVLETIRKARSLNEEQQKKIAAGNLGFIKENYSKDKSLASFEKAILQQGSESLEPELHKTKVG